MDDWFNKPRQVHARVGLKDVGQEKTDLHILCILYRHYLLLVSTLLLGFTILKCLFYILFPPAQSLQQIKKVGWMWWVASSAQ